MNTKIIFLVLVGLGLVASMGGAADWECDPDILDSDNLCIFKRTDGKEGGPHKANTQDFTYRIIRDADGNQVKLSGQPYHLCDTVAESEVEITGNELAFVQLLELMAPLRDLAMFAPNDLTVKKWSEVTQFLVDCEIKDTTILTDDIATTYYDTFDLYDLMKDVSGKITEGFVAADTKDHVLKFLEEAQNEAICIMSDTGTWDAMGHCDDFRLKHGLEEGQSSSCWEAAYAAKKPQDYDFNFYETIDPETCAFETVEEDVEEDEEDEEDAENGGTKISGGSGKGGKR